jgi:hypothetical protein
MRKNNYEFRLKFHNFWSSREFSYEFLLNLQAYEYFLKCLIKFIWIWNPNSDSSFEFKGLNQIHSTTKSEQNSKVFRTKLNMNWISIWIMLKKMKKFTIHTGHTAAHGHSGTLGRGPAAWPKPAAFSSPCHRGVTRACPEHVWRTVSVHWRTITVAGW